MEDLLTAHVVLRIVYNRKLQSVLPLASRKALLPSSLLYGNEEATISHWVSIDTFLFILDSLSDGMVVWRI